MESVKKIHVKLIYVKDLYVNIITLSLATGGTVKVAIDRSGLLEKYPDINLTINKVGIYGEVCDLDTVLKNNDRIEIYQPLLIDPKEARQQRAKIKSSCP